MKLLRFSLAATLALALGLFSAAPAHAATVVGFSFGFLTGKLTFDKVGDPQATSVTVDPAPLGYDGAIFPFVVFGSNNFQWGKRTIILAELTAASSDTAAQGPLTQYFLQIGLSSGVGSAALTAQSCTYGTLVLCDTARLLSEDPPIFTYPSQIPLPAGLPLVLTGLATVAGLKLRKRRAAQV
jgi:hypothetical protein